MLVGQDIVGATQQLPARVGLVDGASQGEHVANVIVALDEDELGSCLAHHTITLGISLKKKSSRYSLDC